MAEKRDSELFYINKTKLNIIEDEDSKKLQPPQKKRKLTLEEKMKNLNCYRNLQPDPHSAPLHHVNPKMQPELDSKRQKKIIKLKSRKAKSILKKKNIKSLDEIVDKKNKLIPIDKKLDCTLRTDFQKDLWNC